MSSGDPRALYNMYHKALMDARVEASKQMQKDAIKKYEIDTRAQSYRDKNVTDLKKIKADNQRAYYKTFVEAMGKLAEFDGKNPMHILQTTGEGKNIQYHIGDGDDREDISLKAYLQYKQENLNTMKLRNLVMGGYLNAVKHFSEYDPDAIARAENAFKRNPNNPPSGVKTASDGRVVIKDHQDGKEKDIKTKTDEDLGDPDLELEGEDAEVGTWYDKGGIMRWDDREQAPASSTSTQQPEFIPQAPIIPNTSPDAPKLSMDLYEGSGNIFKANKGGTQVGAGVSNSAGSNVPTDSTSYAKALEKKLNK